MISFKPHSQVQWNPALRPPRYYGHLVITATFFGRLAKTATNFLLKKKKKILVNTVTSLKRDNFFSPIGDRINGVPLYEF